MNSKSPNDFRWSFRLTGDPYIFIGIASKLQRKSGYKNFVGNHDEYAIAYSPKTGEINKGFNAIIIDGIKAGPDGEIHFTFQPKLKKFSIAIVCIILFMVNRL